jgi:putative zinc finger protein
MSESASIHERVDAFAAGQLAPREAAEFRAHLVDCAACQAALRSIVLPAPVTRPLAAGAVATQPSPITARPSRRRRLLIVTTASLAAVAAVVVLWRATRPEPIVLAQADRRPLEARLSYGAADRWRPYDLARTAGVAREEVRVDTLARLESRGDWRGLAAGYLLGGELERAAAALARAGGSAEVESDRAALALQQHDAATALAHARRALALAPGYAPATWNRALALRDLGLSHSAANAFDAIAARGEVGWGDEAKKRAAAIHASDGERERTRAAADAAGKAMVATGALPPAELVRAYPLLMEHHLEQALLAPLKGRALLALLPIAAAVDEQEYAELADRVRVAAGEAPLQPLRHEPEPHDALVRANLVLERATHRLQTGDAPGAEKDALAGLQLARDAGFDPHDLPRRFLVLLAETARARGAAALADAYVDEARLLMP